MTATDLTLDPEPAERDPATDDMFAGASPGGGPELGETPAPPAAYQVLARKYRPASFDDLIGQEGMVRTLRNAFASGRIAHAFMLTGVRGVGKTTTARLLARALNYESESVHKPSVEDLAREGLHCRAIVEGRHLDVLELDAASRTGVDDMRELLDGVRYAPAEARYKVYVIDEVHMLSPSAFNALLKTLEEPPPHVKFIFATTEIRKVPVTILSRCQRFDLRRVEPADIIGNLSTIAEAEVRGGGGRATLTLIARAAEGSVRDAQSLLDQAMVQARQGETVSAATVRDMLGLADRAQTIELFEKAVRGEAGGAIEAFRVIYRFGADPVTVMLDLLEHCHGAAVAKALGPDALTLPKDQAGQLAAIGAALSAGTLARLWQLLLKAHDETRRAPDPAAAVEMALIRLAFAADLPGPEEAQGVEGPCGRSLETAAATERSSGAPARAGGPSPSSGGMIGAQAPLALRAGVPTANRAANRADPQSFHLRGSPVALISTARRDIGLKLDVGEKYLRLISFPRLRGAIVFEPARRARRPPRPASLVGSASRNG